jgi:Transposase/Transposase IS116/IS110/IS902 family
MSPYRLQVGIDFSQKRADFCLLLPEGQPLELHRAFANSLSGYTQAKQFLQQALQAQPFDGLDVTGEATSYYWMPFFWQLAGDSDLASRGLNLFLLNPRWVHWFKRCFAQDDKSDLKDPFYIAERTRTRPPAHTWSLQTDWLPLRFYTRLRFHLVQILIGEKNFFLAYLFLRCSAYQTTSPFTNLFGRTSRTVLSQPPSLEELGTLSAQELAECLEAWSGHHLDCPLDHAQKLQHTLAESFPIDPILTLPIQRLLELTLHNIHFLEAQIEQVETWIAEEVQAHHPQVLQLATLPGVGQVLAAGIAAEICNLQRFFQGQKWDKKHSRYRSKNLRDVEDSVAKFAGLWWPRSASGDFEAEERHMAKTGNRYLRYYLIQAANGMRLHIPEYSQFYARKFREVPKHQHKRALVLTARKSVGLLVGLLHRKEAYRSKEA